MYRYCSLNISCKWYLKIELKYFEIKFLKYKNKHPYYFLILLHDALIILSICSKQATMKKPSSLAHISGNEDSHVPSALQVNSTKPSSKCPGGHCTLQVDLLLACPSVQFINPPPNKRTGKHFATTEKQQLNLIYLHDKIHLVVNTES